MNQAMPQWRTLSSDSPVESTPGNDDAQRSTHRPRWLLATLAAVGGVALGGVFVLLISLLMGSDPAVDLVDIGEPLEPLPADGAAAAASDITDVGGSVDELVVDVAGAVMQPGLHRLRPGDRVGDAIAAAGGFGPRVDLREASQSLNLAQPLDDGVKVLVPELGIDTLPGRQDSDGRIDLNRAAQDELESLPGIGPVTAGKIIDARKTARFEDVRDLRSREVVGDSVFEDIKELVRVSP